MRRNAGSLNWTKTASSRARTAATFQSNSRNHFGRVFVPSPEFPRKPRRELRSSGQTHTAFAPANILTSPRVRHLGSSFQFHQRSNFQLATPAVCARSLLLLPKADLYRLWSNVQETSPAVGIDLSFRCGIDRFSWAGPGFVGLGSGVFVLAILEQVLRIGSNTEFRFVSWCSIPSPLSQVLQKWKQRIRKDRQRRGSCWS